MEKSWRRSDGTSLLRPLETLSRRSYRTCLKSTFHLVPFIYTSLGVSFETYRETSLRCRRLAAGWGGTDLRQISLKVTIQQQFICNFWRIPQKLSTQEFNKVQCSPSVYVIPFTICKSTELQSNVMREIENRNVRIVSFLRQYLYSQI